MTCIVAGGDLSRSKQMGEASCGLVCPSFALRSRAFLDLTVDLEPFPSKSP